VENCRSEPTPPVYQRLQRHSACTSAWCVQHGLTAAVQNSPLFLLSYGESRPELNSIDYKI